MKGLERLYTGSFLEYCKLIDSWLINGEKKMIVTANPETIMLGKNDEIIKKIFEDKEISFVPDGIGVVKAAKMLNIDVAERIAGIDIANYLLEKGNELKKKIYFFGAKQEVLDSLANVIADKYPNLKVVGMTNGYVDDKDSVFDDIIKLKPDICLVALGIPVQEKLIYKHLSKFKKGIFVGVGGSLDVISGTKKRAPKLFIKLNLEWLYRIICEPKRIKRFYNNNVKFLFEIRKEK